MSAAGFSTIPVNSNKIPTGGLWTRFQKTPPTEAEINQFYSGANAATAGIAIIAGKVSGNIEVFDVDCKHDLNNTLWREFSELLETHLPELFSRLVIAKTKNGGYHIIVRLPEGLKANNEKLAQRPATAKEIAEKPKNTVKDLIETKGEGGYFVVAPSVGYKLFQGDYESIPLITAAQRETILGIARYFDQMPVEPSLEEKAESRTADGLSPFDDYCKRADVPALLERHGWKLHQRSGSRLIYTRPGNTDQKASANYDENCRIFYVFTTSSVFGSGRGYNPVQVYTWLEHGGNFSAASKQLYAEGYGSRRSLANDGGKAAEEIKANILENRLTVAATPFERGKSRITAKNGNGEIIAKNVFNLSEADKRNKFIKEIESALSLSEDEKTAVARELLKLADASEHLTEVVKASDNFELVEFGEDRPAGVYYSDGKGENFRVCSPLRIVAETQTEAGENYGKLIKWTDSQNRPHRWAMPIEFVHSTGSRLAEYLASNGLEIMPSRKHHEKLAFYIATAKTDKVSISTDKIGLHGECFILPDRTFGESENEILYQTEFDGHHNFKTAGTLADWQAKISKYCENNSRLLFAVSAAFAAPLLQVLSMQGGGFHFRGATSTGKTTSLFVGGSVCGGDGEHGFSQTWKATANGLEIIAAGHNHNLLCLDEIGECDGREIGNVAYMLANGRGKARMTKTIAARRSLTWNLMFLSTGEQRLSDKIVESGGTVKGGQEIRLCDIEAETGKFGLFEDLHHFPNGQAFSDYLRSASCSYYGTALRKFLECLVESDFEETRAAWHIFKESFINSVIPNPANVPPEVLRVAARFALVAFGGEMATSAGVTDWNEGSAREGVTTVFLQWLNGREGNGQSDIERGIRQVRKFIQNYETSKFQKLPLKDEEKTIERVGFVRRDEANDSKREFLIFPSDFKAICKGFDAKAVADAMKERGILQIDSAGKTTKQVKIGGLNQRFYLVTEKIFTFDEDTETMNF